MALTEKEIEEIRQKTIFEIPATVEAHAEVMSRKMWKPKQNRMSNSKTARKIQTDLFLALAWIKNKPDEFWDRYEELKKITESTIQINHWNKEFRTGRMGFVEYNRRYQVHLRLLRTASLEAKNYAYIYDLISANLHTKLLLNLSRESTNLNSK